MTELQDCLVLKVVMVPLVPEVCPELPVKTVLLAELERKVLVELQETLEETVLTDSLDLKVMPVLLVFPENEVDPVFPDREKREKPADQVK